MSVSSQQARIAAQRHAALLDGNSVRSLRAQLKRDLRRPGTDAGAMLAGLITDPPGYLGSARIFDVLLWLPGIKGARADVILQAAGVKEPLTTVSALGPAQRAKLAELLQLHPTAVRANRPKPARVLAAAPILDDIPI